MLIVGRVDEYVIACSEAAYTQLPSGMWYVHWANCNRPAMFSAVHYMLQDGTLVCTYSAWAHTILAISQTESPYPLRHWIHRINDKCRPNLISIPHKWDDHHITITLKVSAAIVVVGVGVAESVLYRNIPTAHKGNIIIVINIKGSGLKSFERAEKRILFASFFAFSISLYHRHQSSSFSPSSLSSIVNGSRFLSTSTYSHSPQRFFIVVVIFRREK